MNFKEDTEEVIESLKSFGFTRRTIELELFYSEGYIDQTLSKGGNRKLLAALRMLLKLKTLEKTVVEQGSVSKGSRTFTSKEGKDVDLVVDILRNIDTNLTETRHTVELNQALAKANLYQVARLESISTRATHRSILEGLNKVTAKIFDEMHPGIDVTNASHA